MEKKRIILGLDVSTSCIGTSVASYDDDKFEILYVDYVKFKTSKKYKGTNSLFFKIEQFKELFINKITEWGITDIIIEEPLPGSQNVNTVNTLMKFNGMVSQLIYDRTGIMPQYISSYDARRFGFPDLLAVRKYNKKDEIYPKNKILKALKNNDIVLFGEYAFSCAKKYIIWNKISEKFPNINWVYDKDDELKTENFDASDSIVCILGYINKLKYEEQTPVVKDINTSFIKDNITTITYKIDFCGQTFDKKIVLENG